MPMDSMIEHVDPFKNILPGLISCEIVPMKHTLGVQRLKEAFHHGIVPGIPAPTYARRQAVIGQQLAIPSGGVLGPAIGMMHPRRAPVVDVRGPW